MTLTIANGILEPLNRHVRAYGVQNAEAGGFLLGSYDTGVATVIAVAEGVGVDRTIGFFRVSGKAVDRLFAWAEQQDLRVWAQVHSHPLDSFLSPTDKTYGFRVGGFLSGVIPNYECPPIQPNAWGWWTFDGGEWRSVEPPIVVVSSARIHSFDEAGVR